jgi:hypothetical protein
MSASGQSSRLHHTNSDRKQLIIGIALCRGDIKKIRRMCAFWVIRYLYGGRGAHSSASERTKLHVLKAFRGFI